MTLMPGIAKELLPTGGSCGRSCLLAVTILAPPSRAACPAAACPQKGALQTPLLLRVGVPVLPWHLQAWEISPSRGPWLELNPSLLSPVPIPSHISVSGG